MFLHKVFCISLFGEMVLLLNIWIAGIRKILLQIRMILQQIGLRGITHIQERFPIRVLISIFRMPHTFV